MVNYTINNLPNTVTKLNSADTLPIWDSANSKTAKISGSNLSKSILSNLVTISASSTTVTGLEIKNSSCVKIMFTSAITGSDDSTAMTITYNGTPIPVKVGKQGNLSNFVASEVSSGVYKYLQAYTTLELIYDGTQFIIVGNPVVLSSDSYTIYADGTNTEYMWKIRYIEDTTERTFTESQTYVEMDISSLGFTEVYTAFLCVRNWAGMLIGNVERWTTTTLHSYISAPYENTTCEKLGYIVIGR